MIFDFHENTTSDFIVVDFHRGKRLIIGTLIIGLHFIQEMEDANTGYNIF